MDNNVNLNEVSRISAGTAFKGTIITTGDSSTEPSVPRAAWSWAKAPR